MKHKELSEKDLFPNNYPAAAEEGERITDIVCPVCKKGHVIESTEHSKTRPTELMVMGSTRTANYEPHVSYFCGNAACCIKFHKLPNRV